MSYMTILARADHPSGQRDFDIALGVSTYPYICKEISGGQFLRPAPYADLVYLQVFSHTRYVLPYVRVSIRQLPA